MTVFDWILVALFAGGAYWGFRKGLVNAVLLVASIYIAQLLGAQFAGRLVANFWDDAENQALGTAVGYVIIFAGVFIAGRIVSRFVKATLERFQIGWVDHWGGLALGMVIGLLLSGGLMAVLARYTYVVDENVTTGASGLSKEALLRQLTDAAEDFLSGTARQQIDGWLTRSQAVGALIAIKDVLPGSALGLYPVEFDTAIDILDAKR